MSASQTNEPALQQKLKDNYFKLKLRPEDDFERILLEDVGFAKKEAVKDQSGKGPSSEPRKLSSREVADDLACRTGFDRTLEIYHKA